MAGVEELLRLVLPGFRVEKGAGNGAGGVNYALGGKTPGEGKDRL
ncbi:MAG: hypothetical protein AB2448_11980 [Moorella sp. (in: firmicutes)]